MSMAALPAVSSSSPRNPLAFTDCSFRRNKSCVVSTVSPRNWSRERTRIVAFSVPKHNSTCKIFNFLLYHPHFCCRLTLLDTQGTLTAGDAEDYQVSLECGPAKINYSIRLQQKVTVLSPDGAFIAVGGNHDASHILPHPNGPKS